MASFQKYTTKQGQLWMFKPDTGINPETGKRQTTTRRDSIQRRRLKRPQLSWNEK